MAITGAVVGGILVAVWWLRPSAVWALAGMWGVNSLAPIVKQWLRLT